MKISTMSKEFACELLAYVAENDDFAKVCDSLGGEVTREEIAGLLREITVELQKEILADSGDPYNVKKCKHLTKDTKKILSYLSPMEEKKILKAFGLTENK